MSHNWKIKHDHDGNFTVYSDDQLDLFPIASSLNDSCSDRDFVNIPYSCSVGSHEWQWYEGLRERFWFCKVCDIKDKDKIPPPRKKR